MTTILNSLEMNHTLIELNIGNEEFTNSNKFGSKACLALRIYLEKQAEIQGPLISLGLRYLQIDDAGLSLIAHGLQKNQNIQ